MIQKTTLALAFTTVTLVGALAAPAQAASFNLGQLINSGGSITIGDKKFSNFTCNLTVIGTGTPKDCNTVNVITLDNDPLGLRFQTGFRAGSPGKTQQSSLTALLGYDVEVLDPNQRLSGIKLGFNGSGGPATSFTNGNLMLKVTETVKSLDAPSTTVGTAQVTNPPIKLNDADSLDQLLTKARVENLIEIKAKNKATGTISFVDNQFEQTEVPEPGTVGGLVVLGALGIGFKIKRDRK